MLRQSLLEEAQNDWHPPIPKKDVILEQIAEAKGRIAGNERFSTSRISLQEYLPSEASRQLMRFELRIRGGWRLFGDKLRGLK